MAVMRGFKKGESVFALAFGKGTVVNVRQGITYSIHVEFNNEVYGTFTNDGLFSTADDKKTLFHTDEIEMIIKPFVADYTNGTPCFQGMTIWYESRGIPVMSAANINDIKKVFHKTEKECLEAILNRTESLPSWFTPVKTEDGKCAIKVNNSVLFAIGENWVTSLLSYEPAKAHLKPVQLKDITQGDWFMVENSLLLMLSEYVGHEFEFTHLKIKKESDVFIFQERTSAFAQSLNVKKVIFE